MLSRAICWLDGAPCIGLLYPLKLLERHKFSIAQRGLLRFAVMVLWLRNSQKTQAFRQRNGAITLWSSYVLQHDEIICGIKKLCRCDAGFQFSARARRTLKFHFANYARSNSPGLGKGCSHPSFVQPPSIGRVIEMPQGGGGARLCPVAVRAASEVEWTIPPDKITQSSSKRLMR
jgi:hypothetical protein